MSNRYNSGSTTGGNRSNNNSSNDPYDFDVSDDFTESTDETSSKHPSFNTSTGSRNTSANNANNRSSASYTRGNSSSNLYGRNNTSHSSRFDALSPPTDSDDSSSLSSEASPILRPNSQSLRGNSGSPSRRTTRFGTTSSTNTSLNRTVSSNNLSIEERVAARLAKLDSERQQKLGGGGGNSSAPNSQPNSQPSSAPQSLNTTAVSIGTGNTNANNNNNQRARSSSFTRTTNTNDEQNDSNDNEEDEENSHDNDDASFHQFLGSTNLSTASRGRNLGGTNASTINSTYSTINNRTINSTYQSKPILGSPLSPGEADTSSSIDLSSGDFQVGAIAARALAARRAAAQNSNTNSVITETQRRDEESEDISISTDNETSTELRTKYTNNHHHRTRKHDSRSTNDEEDSFDDNENDDDENDEENTETTEHEESNESSDSLKKAIEILPRSSTSPFRGVIHPNPSSSISPSPSGTASQSPATATVSPTRSSGNKFSFADIAMMMRQAALDAKRASATSTDSAKPTDGSGGSSTTDILPKDGNHSVNDATGRNRVSTLGSLEGSLDDNRVTDSGRDTANSDLRLGSDSRNSNGTIEIDAGPYRPAIISFGDFVTQTPSTTAAATATTTTTTLPNTMVRSSFNSLPTVTVTSTPNDSSTTTNILHNLDTNAALARNLRAAASAALSKQLQAITTAQNQSKDNDEPLQPPSVLLQQFVSNANDTAEVDEPEEVIPPPPPRGRTTSVPLRAQPIRNAMNEVGFTHRRDSSSNGGYDSGYTSRSRSRSASVNNDHISDHPRLPRPIRMTNAHAARSAIARDYVASHPDPEKYRQAREEIRTHKQHHNHGKDINFHLVTHGGEYLVGVMHSPQMIKKAHTGSRTSSGDTDDHPMDQEMDGTSEHYDENRETERNADDDQNGTSNDTQELPGSTQKVYLNAGEDDEERTDQRTTKHDHHHHVSPHPSLPQRPPENMRYGREDPYTMANALIADAAAARFRAENQVKELQTALADLEARLTSSETGSKGDSAKPSSRDAVEARPSATSLSLYTILREAVTNLTVHRPLPVNDINNEKNVYSMKRFIKDRENMHRTIRREWGPTVPPTTDGEDTQNNTVTSITNNASSPSTAFFNELPIAEAAAAANTDGYRAYVPLELIASLQAELLAQEKMLNAYHTDNERLREQLTVAKERAEVAKNATQLATADALAAAQAIVSANTLVTTLQSSNAIPNQLERTHDRETNGITEATNMSVVGTGSTALELERLRSELAHVREESRLRQEELAYEVDRLRKAKKDLECKVAGVDMTAVSKDAEEVVKLRATLQETHLSHEREITALRTKLDWYRDNQAIIDADAATISHQAETIRELQTRIWNLQTEKVSGKVYRPGSPRTVGKEGTTIVNNLVTPKKGASPTGGERTSPTSTIGSPRSSAFVPVLNGSGDAGKELVLAHQRIKELERNLSVAEEALSKRYPDSIANLIREAKGADSAVGEPAAVLAELENLKTTSAAKEEMHDRALRSLRQEHERIRAEYERRENSMKEDMNTLRVRLAALGDTGTDDAFPMSATDGTNANDLGASTVVSKRELALRNKVKELETELERVRTFYQKKVKDERNSAGTPVTTTGTNKVNHSRTGTPVPPTLPSTSATPTNTVEKKEEKPKASTPLPTVGKDKPKITNATLPAKSTVSKTEGNSKTQTLTNPSRSREPSPSASRRSSISSTASSAISKVSTSKPSLPSVPKIPSSAKSKSTLSAPKEKKETGIPSKLPKTKETTNDTPKVSAATVVDSNNTDGSSTNDNNDTHQRIQELLQQVSRLEAENTQLKASSTVTPTPNNETTVTDTPSPVTLPSVTGDTVEASLATVAAISTSARSTQENLQRQVDQLYSAISILEARAEAREMELARAETSVRRAREAAEVLARTQYEDALRAKDDALRAAKAEVQELMGIVLMLQQQQQFLQSETMVHNTSIDWDENNLTTRTVVPQATEFYTPKDTNGVSSPPSLIGGSPGGALRSVTVSGNGAFRSNGSSGKASR